MLGVYCVPVGSGSGFKVWSDPDSSKIEFFLQYFFYQADNIVLKFKISIILTFMSKEKRRR